MRDKHLKDKNRYRMRENKISNFRQLEKPDEFVIDLIVEELKIYRVFNILREAGFCDSYFEPSLETVILKSIGLNGSDKTRTSYFQILEKHSCRITTENNSITKEAAKVYHELLRKCK